MYEKIVLDNGVRIVYQKMANVRSCALGIWVGNGSRHEPSELSGMSHFIEHMIFKGTQRRSLSDIAREMDAIGGQVNAFTTKECTCFHLKTLDKYLAKGIDILSDMFFNSKFDQKDIDLERGVILEEIDMYEDSPEDVATERIFENCYEKYALGRPILGNKESLFNIDSKGMHNYIDTYYRPHDVVVSVAGSFSMSDIDIICKLFSQMKSKGKNTIEKSKYTPKTISVVKDIEQNHICIGFKGLPSIGEDRYKMILLSNMLGGGMSSRLFQSVREQKGLCYSIYSFNSSHIDTGMFNIYTALNKSSEEMAISLICDILEEFKKTGPTESELYRVCEQAKINIFLGSESTHNRMMRLGKGELFLENTISDEELVEKYSDVTINDIKELAESIIDFNSCSICAVGKVRNEDFYNKLINNHKIS